MCREYEKFDILEVAAKCGIKLYPNKNSTVGFKACCPFCGDTKYHLGIYRGILKEYRNTSTCTENVLETRVLKR